MIYEKENLDRGRCLRCITHDFLSFFIFTSGLIFAIVISCSLLPNISNLL